MLWELFFMMLKSDGKRREDGRRKMEVLLNDKLTFYPFILNDIK